MISEITRDIVSSAIKDLILRVKEELLLRTTDDSELWSQKELIFLKRVPILFFNFKSWK